MRREVKSHSTGEMVTRRADHAAHIDVAELNRLGVMHIGAQMDINWSYQRTADERAMRHARLKNKSGGLEIRVSLGPISGHRRIATTLVPFVQTQNRFGVRRWFLCPVCTCACRIVYLEHAISCRKCQKLTYDSQYESAWERSVRRLLKLRNRVGGSRSLLDPFPQKPPTMRWKTYFRLQSQYMVSVEQLASHTKNCVDSGLKFGAR